MSLLEAARACARRGWRVFPLAPGSKRPRAALVEWERQATTDLERIGRWWRRHPSDNVGIACGPSGLVMVDLDAPKPGESPPGEWAGARHGVEVLGRLARRHGSPVECTWTVRTPGGGWHLYYRTPPGAELRNTHGRLGWRIDTRAAGGYVVAAGSTVARRPYTVAVVADVVELPAWLTQLAAPPPAPTPARSTPAVTAGRYVDVALAAEVQRVLDAGPGGRNWALNKAAWNLGRLVAAGQLDRADAEAALQAAGEAAGYRDGPRAVAAVIRAALDARLGRRTA